MEPVVTHDAEPTDAVRGLTNAHAVAMSAGDLSLTVLSETRRLLKETNGNALAATKLGLQRLERDGHISASEENDLESLLDELFGSVKQKDTEKVAHAATETRSAYHRLAAARSASPTALAIAGLCAAAYNPKPPLVQAPGGAIAVAATVTITPGDTATGAVIGGVIGGIIGGIAGGGLGAGIGAAIGGAAGAAIGACNE